MEEIFAEALKYEDTGIFIPVSSYVEREEEEQMSMGNEDQEGNSDFGAEKNER